MNVIEIKNGVQVNKEFDKVKVQGFFQTSEMLENVLGFRYLLKCQTKVRSFVVQEENTDLVDSHKNKKTEYVICLEVLSALIMWIVFMAIFLFKS